MAEFEEQQGPLLPPPRRMEISDWLANALAIYCFVTVIIGLATQVRWLVEWLS